jgi:hypothetical protein
VVESGVSFCGVEEGVESVVPGFGVVLAFILKEC